MLTEEPTHAYRTQQLIKERCKDEVANVSQRNSVYQTIQRLVRDGLVAVASTERAENRPERTTYRITDAGRVTSPRTSRGSDAWPTRDPTAGPLRIHGRPRRSSGHVHRRFTAPLYND
ncbi:PadR family transcriptional regulator [Plantactinospora sp. WMMB334]|uniref:PadR family transcriptional regulator n=1 Tax=Plantactinospora sp. WMMB334 TaxID=3404119 RepID=UPI003B950309